jgi:hypothetical protein
MLNNTSQLLNLLSQAMRVFMRKTIPNLTWLIWASCHRGRLTRWGLQGGFKVMLTKWRIWAMAIARDTNWFIQLLRGAEIYQKKLDRRLKTHRPFKEVQKERKKGRDFAAFGRCWLWTHKWRFQKHTRALLCEFNLSSSCLLSTPQETAAIIIKRIRKHSPFCLHSPEFFRQHPAAA